MNIKEIENLTEDMAKEMAIETMEVKGFNIYFVEIEGAFGYSYLVFKNNHHIKHANDYELHHGYIVKEEGKEALRSYYIERINDKLFTDEEIASELSSYDEYERKNYFLTNLYALQQDYLSIFCINPSKEEQEAFEKAKENMTYDPVGFCYIKDKAFVEKHIALKKKLLDAKENTVNNFEYQKNAFLYEMYNHEYAINWQADYDTLSAFGRLTYREDDDVNKYFDELGFNEIQRNAYKAAREEYYKKQEAA